MAINYAKHRYCPSLMSGGRGIGSRRGCALGTLNAAGGWTWVGENGPELLRFRGGEQVYNRSQLGKPGDVHYYVEVNVAGHALRSQQEMASRCPTPGRGARGQGP